MLCDHCRERDAVVHLTQIENDTVNQIHLCERCAAERGVETTVAETKHPLGELLHAVQAQMAPPDDAEGACSFCGTTMADFRARGRWGCPHCYTTFESSMRSLLRRLHGSTQHVGDRYDPPHSEAMERNARLLELRDRLQRAIDAEQFELAADLRDRIRVLE
ncbi:MAG TPA: UvrB/UvrC motif-containing protein [Gemmatimonadaceae bacterium]|jgi:protein arginine kinase activator|nr:UvrB/UvrC motif-containing protein [Gemmatimonadaceae bacterium]